MIWRDMSDINSILYFSKCCHYLTFKLESGRHPWTQAQITQNITTCTVWRTDWTSIFLETHCFLSHLIFTFFFEFLFSSLFFVSQELLGGTNKYITTITSRSCCILRRGKHPGQSKGTTREKDRHDSWNIIVLLSSLFMFYKNGENFLRESFFFGITSF